MKMLVLWSVLSSSLALAAENVHVYRLDFVVTETDAQKSSVSTYSLNVEEKHWGELRVGSNVPLVARDGSSRADIGLALRTSVLSLGDDLLLSDELEITTPKDAQTFRKLATKGDALLSPGKSAVVASVEDPQEHRRYQVTVTATKLR